MGRRWRYCADDHRWDAMDFGTKFTYNWVHLVFVQLYPYFIDGARQWCLVSTEGFVMGSFHAKLSRFGLFPT
eukprot:12410796-Ditylum_brightwellii.AAC.1